MPFQSIFCKCILCRYIIENMRVSMINDIGKYCACQAAMKIQYTKITTSTNDPKMSKRMKYASYVNTTKTLSIPYSSLNKWYG